MGLLNMITEEVDDARVSQKSPNKAEEGKDGTKEGTFAFLKNISVEPCSFLFSLPSLWLVFRYPRSTFRNLARLAAISLEIKLLMMRFVTICSMGLLQMSKRLYKL